MSDPRHRKPKRKRGVTVRGGQGRRRNTGALDTRPTDARRLRRSAREAIARQNRRKVVAATVGAVLIVGGAVVASWWALRPGPPADLTVEAPTDQGVSTLLYVTDGDEATSLALVAAHPQFGDRVVLFPPALLTGLPGFGDRQISQADRFGGPELVELTVMNLLGVRVDAVVELPAAGLGAAIARPMTVDVPSPLLRTEGADQVVAVAAGRGERSPDQLVALLTEPGVDDQLAWLTRQGAVWTALLGRLGTDEDLVDRLTSETFGAPDVARQTLVTAAQDPEVVVTAVPAQRIEPAGGGEEDRYYLPGDAGAGLVAEAFPYLALRPEPRPRVEILNGNGRVGTTQPVAALLVRQGYRVVKTDNADASDYEVTRLIAQGTPNQQNALDIRELLGLGDVYLEQRQPSTVVDITIIVGEDVPAQED